MILTFTFSPIDKFYHIYKDGKEIFSSNDKNKIIKKWDRLKKASQNRELNQMKGGN